MEHNNSIEKIGTGLVCSLETFKGATINLVQRLSGFNGLSIYKDGKVRKIEVKTMAASDKWIAINGVRAIDKLFFERDYWIYFVLYPENIVISTKGLKFIQTQLDISNTSEEIRELEQWMLLSKKLTKNNKFKFTPKINVIFPIPIRKLHKNFEEYKEKFSDSVIEIWQNTNNNWQLVHKSNKYEEL